MPEQAVKISYHTADTCGCRRMVRPEDACGNYSSFEEAKCHYSPDLDGDSAILANINGEWYRVSDYADGNEVVYKHLDRLFGDWHRLEDVIAGVSISNIPFNDMLAMAAATAYCNGTLAKAIGVTQDALYAYDFYERFAEHFGKPMYEFKI